MLDDSHAPGWRGRPKRYGPIIGMNDRDATFRRVIEEGEQLVRICTIGCELGAAFCLGAAAYLWAEPVAAWIRAIL